MLLQHLWLADYRNYEAADLELGPGFTAVLGDNGQGKTNLVEAIAWIATMESFRGAPGEALVRHGADRAVVRAEVRHDDGRELLVEAELVPGGRSRVQVNRQRLQRSRDLLGVLRVTVFSPDDLVLVKGGPGERRRFLDDLMVALRPRDDLLRTDLDRILRQRNTLLKSAAGRLGADVSFTLDVWDAKLVEVGELLGQRRAEMVESLEPLVTKAYGRIAGAAATIGLRYEPRWRRTGLAAALAEARGDDVRRAATTVGPHRDELEMWLGGLPGRTHASQGEQRSLALALRLAGHDLVCQQVGSPPVLLLDDVFSELDPERSRALLEHLPRGQVVLTTAGALPPDARPDRVVQVRSGRLGAS